MKITVYSKPACVQCNATKRALDRRGLAYELVDLTQDVEAYARVTAMGHRSAPVVTVETEAGLQHWSGFDPGQIGAL